MLCWIIEVLYISVYVCLYVVELCVRVFVSSQGSHIMIFHIVWCRRSVPLVTILLPQLIFYADGIRHIQFGYVVKYNLQ